MEKLRIPLCSVVLCVLLACPAALAGTNDIALDSVGSCAADGTCGAGTTTISWTHTVGTGANSVLVVGVAMRDARNVTSVTYGGIPLARAGGRTALGNSNRVEIWGLLSPPAGTATVTVTVAFAVPGLTGGSMSFFNVSQTAPLRTTGGVSFFSDTSNSTVASVNVSSSDRDTIVDVVALDGDGLSLTATNQDEQWNTAVGGAAGIIGAQSLLPGAAGIVNPPPPQPAGAPGNTVVTDTWRAGTKTKWSIGAISLVPAAVPTAVEYDVAKATRCDGGPVALRWRTAHELSNLGFRIYRDVDGHRARAAGAFVAGSALAARTAAAARLRDREYVWLDDAAPAATTLRYWIEDVELRGRRRLYGPIAVERTCDGGAAAVASATIADVQRNRIAPVVTGPVFERARQLRPVKSAEANDSALQQSQWRIAANASLKISIRDAGWYRITGAELIAAGVDRRIDPRKLQLFTAGRPVALRVRGDEARELSPATSIEFYASGTDTPYTDRRAYFLAWSDASAARVPAVHAEAAAAPPASFAYEVSVAPRSIYQPMPDGSDFLGPVVTSTPLAEVLPASHIDPAPPAALEVSLQGFVLDGTSAAHDVRVTLNGADVGRVRWSGQTPGSARFAVAPSLLREGANSVTLSAADDDISTLDRIRLTYGHTYDADADRLAFTARGGMPVSVGGFTTAAVRLVDITDETSPVELLPSVRASGGTWSVDVAPAGTGLRRLLAVAEPRIDAASSLSLRAGSSWHDAPPSDVLIISHRHFLAAASALRTLHEGRKQSVSVIDVDDLYDELSFGEKDPRAVRDFLAAAARKSPRRMPSVILIGDASADPRNYLGAGDADFLPVKRVPTSFGPAPSDDWFGDLDGDGVSELPIGRIAVRTAADAARAVAKIAAYASAPAAAWQHRALIVTDAHDANLFDPAAASTAATLLPAITSDVLLTSHVGASAARASLLAGWNAGAGIVAYWGHGSVGLWSEDHLLSSDDAGQLTNAARLPLVIGMTCLSGSFDDVYAESLAESLLGSPGGAAGVWTSSALVEPDQQPALSNAFLQALLRGATFGEAAIAAKRAVTDPDLRRTWTFFGDPALTLR